MGLEGCKRNVGQDVPALEDSPRLEMYVDQVYYGRSGSPEPGVERHYIRPTLKSSLDRIRAKIPRMAYFVVAAEAGRRSIPSWV
jgi:hypothetical protein